MIDDRNLLRRYAQDRAEDAFAEFVRRNLPLVFSAALRRLGGDAHRAEDIAQIVFCAAARDAQRLSEHAALTGWLYTATRNAVIDAVRSDQRRRVREKEAHMIQEISHDTEPAADWSQLGPVLDEAMDELNGDDRTAVLLRFFQDLPFAEIGVGLGLSEDAARKRVERALDKLGTILRRHGIGSTSVALGTLLSSHAIGAVPAGLASTITGAALAAGGATAGVAVITLTKLKIGLAAATIAGGTIGLVSQQRTIQALRDDNAAAQQQLARLTTENAALVRARAETAANPTNPDAPAGAPTNASGSATRTSAAKSSGATRTSTTSTAKRTLPTLPDTLELRQRRASLHRRYDPFFKQRGMTTAEGDRFVELKLHQAIMREEFQAAVRAANLRGDSSAVRRLRSQDDAPVTEGLHELLGPEGYKAYGKYEGYSALRLTYVEPLQPRFAEVRAPLTENQIDRLIDAIAANQTQRQIHPTDIGTVSEVNWDAVFAQTKDLLTPEQQAVLRESSGHIRTSYTK